VRINVFLGAEDDLFCPNPYDNGTNQLSTINRQLGKGFYYCFRQFGRVTSIVLIRSRTELLYVTR